MTTQNWKRVSTGLRWSPGCLEILDQTRLPHEEVWVRMNQSNDGPGEMIEAIQKLRVRGAPLIGVAAAMQLAECARRLSSRANARNEILDIAEKLRNSRPTAVNLMNAMDRMITQFDTPADLESRALELFDEDVELCLGMARSGEPLIQSGDGVLTHCNTGGLATVGLGTALSVILHAHAQGKKIHVYVSEARPLYQGARLTTWELERAGVPFTLITDSMAATLMRLGKIQKVFLGSDRIARNGDAANKIGTYSHAVSAFYHQIPFYVVAPWTTIDYQCPTGSDIPIEERTPDEVRGQHALKTAPVWNPSFDVTPARLIKGLVLDKGVFAPQDLEKNLDGFRR